MDFLPPATERIAWIDRIWDRIRKTGRFWMIEKWNEFWPVYYLKGNTNQNSWKREMRSFMIVPRSLNCFHQKKKTLIKLKFLQFIVKLHRFNLFLYSVWYCWHKIFILVFLLILKFKEPKWKEQLQQIVYSLLE